MSDLDAAQVLALHARQDYQEALAAADAEALGEPVDIAEHLAALRTSAEDGIRPKDEVGGSNPPGET